MIQHANYPHFFTAYKGSLTACALKAATTLGSASNKAAWFSDTTANTTHKMKLTPTSGLSRRTPDEASVAIVDARARINVARALVHLVVQVNADDSNDPDSPTVRESLRQLVARLRHTSITVHATEGSLLIEGVALNSSQINGDRWLKQLATLLHKARIASLAIKEAAAPGELYTLARAITTQLRSQSDAQFASAAPSEHAELLRSWSVLLTAVNSKSSLNKQPAAATASSRTDSATVAAIASYTANISSIVGRNDAKALASIAVALAHAVNSAGAGSGRLASEDGLRQLLSEDAIKLLAEALPAVADRAAITAVFARAGDTAVRALLHGLMNAPDALARRSYFDTIVAIDQGGARLLDALNDERWYVVRNTAALIAEMNIADADIKLEQLLTNTDERIRIAVARALVRLRTPRALSALHNAIDDSNSEVRRIAATSFSIAAALGARPAGGKLAAALDSENDEDVALEMMSAMGRMGSADAVQRLLRIVQSPTEGTPSAAGAKERGYNARPSWVRVAALEALMDARGNAVAHAIEPLTRDEDEIVAGVAESFLR